MSTQNVNFARFARIVVKWDFFSDFQTTRIILYFRMNQRGMNQTFIEPTEMRLDPRYTTYYLSWTRAFLLALFPFVLLLILNGKIIRQLKKSENISSSARVINFIMDINCIICRHGSTHFKNELTQLTTHCFKKWVNSTHNSKFQTMS